MSTFTAKVLFKGPLSGLKQYLANKNPVKMMKNTFYLTLMAVLVLKIFIFLNFCLDGFGHAEKLDDKKGKVNFKIYDVKNWKTLITIHIVSNVSKSKGN